MKTQEQIQQRIEQLRDWRDNEVEKLLDDDWSEKDVNEINKLTVGIRELKGAINISNSKIELQKG